MNLIRTIGRAIGVGFSLAVLVALSSCLGGCTAGQRAFMLEQWRTARIPCERNTCTAAQLAIEEGRAVGVVTVELGEPREVPAQGGRW
jgi:hypothetical protein